MYLMGSFCAESGAGNVNNDAQRITRSRQELGALRIRFVSESVCLYRLRRAEVNGPRYLFRAGRRKAKRMLFTHDFAASSMQGIQHATSRRASFEKVPALFARDGAP
jgi:hypothetical protein